MSRRLYISKGKANKSNQLPQIIKLAQRLQNNYIQPQFWKNTGIQKNLVAKYKHNA